MRRTILAILGISIALLGLAIAIAIAADLFTDNESGTAGNVIGFIFVAAAACGGAVLAWSNLRTQTSTKANPSDLEHRILALAAKTDARLTVAEVALECRTSVAESKAALSSLMAAGVASAELSDSGDLVYVFTGLEPSDGAGRRARRPRTSR